MNFIYNCYIYIYTIYKNPGDNHKGNVENQVLNSKYTK